MFSVFLIIANAISAIGNYYTGNMFIAGMCSTIAVVLATPLIVDLFFKDSKRKWYD